MPPRNKSGLPNMGKKTIFPLFKNYEYWKIFFSKMLWSTHKIDRDHTFDIIDWLLQPFSQDYNLDSRSIEVLCVSFNH